MSRNKILSVVEEIDLNNVESIFVPEDEQGQAAIKITFKISNQGQRPQKTYHFNTKKKEPT